MEKVIYRVISFIDASAMEVFFSVIAAMLVWAAVPAIMAKLATSRDLQHYQVERTQETHKSPCGENSVPVMVGEKTVQCVTKRGHRTGKPIPMTTAFAPTFK